VRPTTSFYRGFQCDPQLPFIEGFSATHNFLLSHYYLQLLAPANHTVIAFDPPANHTATCSSSTLQATQSLPLTHLQNILMHTEASLNYILGSISECSARVLAKHQSNRCSTYAIICNMPTLSHTFLASLHEGLV
jgi:hypothetical protein